MINKKFACYFQIVSLVLMTFAVSYSLYYSSGEKEKNPLDSLFSEIGNQITKPIFASVEAATISQPSVCCELTKDGAKCVNTDSSNCAAGKQQSPTSCETTSYCKQGTCYDSNEGICMENTPQSVCNANGGTWDERSADQVPQCQLGCCVIADQAAFVPLVRCKKLSSFFGVSMNYKNTITSEIDCIATAQSQDSGACVFEQDFQKTCKFTTRADCNAQEGVVIAGNATNETIGSIQKKFYKDYLCSAEELGTNCARQASTSCSGQKVYWLDSCGNKENIYSNDKTKSWNNGKVLDDASVCAGNGGSNINCGNCDYLQGSRCAAVDSSFTKPAYGSYSCKRTDCSENGVDYKNGESWCVYDSSTGNTSDPVGSRQYRKICVDGEVRVEPCGDYRSQVCIQDKITTDVGDFKTAGCRVNRWQDCIVQTKEKDCNNTDKRDCTWLPSVTGLILGGSSSSGSSTLTNPTASTTAFTNPTATSITGKAIAPVTGFASSDSTTNETVTNRPNGVCVPNVPPGLKFWESGDATSICGQASLTCIVKYEKRLIGDKECVENCDCLDGSWAQQANNICKSLGDCGGYVNYKGSYTDDGYEWKVDGTEKKFTGNQVNQLIAPTTGNSVALTGNVISPITGFADKVVGTGKDSQGSFTRYQKTDGSSYVQYDTSGSSGSAVSGVATGAAVAPTVLQTATKDAPKLASVTAPKAGTVQTLNSYNLEGGTIIKDKAVVISSENGDSLINLNTKAAYTYGTDGWVPTGTSAENFGYVSKTIGTPSGNVEALVSGNGQGTTAIASDGTKYAWSDKAGTWTSGASNLPTANQAWLAQVAGTGVGTWQSAALGAVQWAAVAYGVGYLAGSLFGMSKGNTQAIATSFAAAAGIYEGLASYNPFISWAGPNAQLYAGAIGIGVGAAIFLYMYKTESSETVTFQCMPWQAPNGGSNCEKCNDAKLPCSEYRCKSLGQSCALLNKGTTEEKCTSVAINDVSEPVISPNIDKLTSGYKYTEVQPNPPSAGFKIINLNNSNGCAKAFTPLQFGVDTNKPAQCKIDFNHTEKFDDMQFWFGNSNLYGYNHTEQFVLPGTKDLQNSSLVLQNGKDLVFFIRCKDANGNTNSAEYAAKLCIDPSPDTTAPEIKATSIVNNGCIAENQNNANVNFYTNEPADCRWSQDPNVNYDNMKNNMVCQNKVYQINALQLYTCTANLTGISKDTSDFYVRCRDQPQKVGVLENERNTNAQDYKFSLRGSNALKIKTILPNETIFGAVNPAPVQLSVQTLFGCDNAKAICYYSTTGRDGDYVMFYDTNKDSGIHNQPQYLQAGQYTYYIKCTDSGGNTAVNTTTFNVEIDTNAPVIARAYNEDNLLKIVTVRNSSCAWSFENCDFSFSEGTEMPYANTTVHVADWKTDKTYYIKCKDEYKNEPADCSLIVKPYQKL